jgi:uncharacterized protein
MTYLITGETKDSQVDILDILFKKFFNKSFREISERGENPDIHILDGEGKNSIGIEEVKELQSELFFHPFENSFQTGIVFEAEKLTPEAQNAFLKTLEESSDETIFVLCTTNEKNLLPTIVSRSRKIFAPKNSADIHEEGKDIHINGDLVEIFGKIEEVSADSERALDFLKSLENTYKLKLERDIKEKDSRKSANLREDLKNIQEAKIRILANGNRRLVLENLILKLRK